MATTPSQIASACGHDDVAEYLDKLRVREEAALEAAREPLPSYLDPPEDEGEIEVEPALPSLPAYDAPPVYMDDDEDLMDEVDLVPYLSAPPHVDEPGDDLFAAAALAQDQDRNIDGGHAAHLVVKRTHGRTGGDKIAILTQFFDAARAFFHNFDAGTKHVLQD